jgi:hypothetical protein
MIGAVDEAKEKAKSSKSISKDSAEPKSKTETQGDVKPTANSKPKDKSETPPKSGANPQPQAEHADPTHES